MMRIIDSDTLLQQLDPDQLVAAIRRGHTQAAIESGQHALQVHAPDGSQDEYIVLSAWQAGHSLGSKIATIFPGNPKRGSHPSIHSCFILFDGVHGGLRALITGQAFTRYKTAADSALGALLLARNQPETLTVFGAGAQAAVHIRVFAHAFPSIRRVFIHNRTIARATALAQQLAAQLDGIDLQASSDTAHAVKSADIVCCLTGSRAPLFDGRWLQPGAHVDLVGGYAPHMRESDDHTIRRARIFVDDRDRALDSGDLHDPIQRGVITPAAICGDLYALCRKQIRGRQADSDITLYKNAGDGHIDLMVAQCLYAHGHDAVP